MGFHFRKSIKAGPFRFTLSKSGISTSFGVKGARITKRADGRTQGTVRIPGTGIYYTHDLTAKQAGSDTSANTGGKRRWKGPLIAAALVLVILMIILFTSGCAADEPSLTTIPTELRSLPVIEIVETTAPLPTEPTTEPTTVPTTEPTTRSTPEPSGTVDPDEHYVLNMNTKKFHHLWCSSVDEIKEKNRRDFTGTRDTVIAEGYDPCKRCNP